MIIYIDENLSPSLARALDILEQREPKNFRFSVKCIQDAFKKGFKDPTLIPMFGKQKAIWITQDKNLLKRKAELKLIMNHQIGLIILTPYWSHAKHWEKVKLIINKWEDIKKLYSESKPFAYRIDGNGTLIKVERIKNGKKKKQSGRPSKI